MHHDFVLFFQKFYRIFYSFDLLSVLFQFFLIIENARNNIKFSLKSYFSFIVSLLLFSITLLTFFKNSTFVIFRNFFFSTSFLTFNVIFFFVVVTFAVIIFYHRVFLFIFDSCYFRCCFYHVCVCFCFVWLIKILFFNNLKFVRYTIQCSN